MTSDMPKPIGRNTPIRVEGLSLENGLDYRIIFNATSNGMAFTESDSGRIIDINDAWIRATGIVREQAVGRTAFELGLWASQAEREACLAELSKRGAVVDFEARLIMKSVELPHLISGQIVKMSDRQYVLWEFRDVSEQKRMNEVLIRGEEKVKALLAASEQSRQTLLRSLEDEKLAKEALRESESRIKSISNNFTAGMIYQVNIKTDGTRRFTYLSDSVRQLYGVSPEEGLADEALIYSKLYAEDIAQLIKTEEEAAKTLSTFRAEVRIKDPSGEIRWSSLVSTPRILEDGSTCWDGIEFVITERKRAEETLRESEALYRQAIEVAGAVPYRQFYAESGTIVHYTFIGEGIRQITGYGPQEFDTVLWDSITLERVLLEELAEHSFNDAIQQVRSGAIPIWKCEHRIRARDGSIHWVFEAAVELRDENGIAHGSIGLFQDITNRKQAEIEREKLITELSAKNAELERFTYTVSHDLKSPIVTIRGFLGYLTEDALSGNTTRMENDIQRITTATDKMQDLLHDLLELSRIGRMMNAPENIPFEDLLHDALDIVHGQLEARGVTVQIQPNLPAVHGDRQRLTEVLQNLLDNAAKYMGDQPAPRIEIGQRGEDAERGQPIFFVKDNGIGIALEYHERIFGLFNKLDPRSEGTGIGLALVKRIVEVHDGRIWVESELRKGSTFYFSLPKNLRR